MSSSIFYCLESNNKIQQEVSLESNRISYYKKVFYKTIYLLCLAKNDLNRSFQNVWQLAEQLIEKYYYFKSLTA